MGEVRLGKIHLRWCDRCGVPILEQRSCGACGAPTREVGLTPPGDARPAFERDVLEIRRLIDSQFGEGTGERALPPGRIVLLNKAPDIDRMDEVVVGGRIIGARRFTLHSGYRFLLRPEGAVRIAPKLRMNWVIVDSAAAQAIRDRRASALGVGVLECSDDIVPGAEVVVLDPEHRPVSVGSAKMSSAQMRARERGTAVKSRWTIEPELAAEEIPEATWERVIEANHEVLSRRVGEAVRFVRRIVEESRLPVAVSYSGGKDSLATLLLVLEAGIRPKLLFVDTGLDFWETKENVREVAEEFGLELVIESAGDSFWKNLEFFGPPAKDFRWCCKTCKLGPATRLIQRNFPNGVLSFIGQRAYESEQRARKGRVWKNPWTPNQLGASPIHRWTAMHVWIYLMSKAARANALYSLGLERIGCFMCPASDMAELTLVAKLSKEYARWQEYLESYAKRTSKPKAWLEKGLWRWKKVPKSVLDELGESVAGAVASPEATPVPRPLEFRGTSGYSPCVEGLSMEGVFSASLDMRRVANMLNVLGEVTTSPDGAIAEASGVTVFREGPVMVRAKDEQELRAKASNLRELVLRAMNCVGCGICIGRCPSGAMSLDGRVWIDPGMCTHCGSCLGPCPVVAFREDQLDI